MIRTVTSSEDSNLLSNVRGFHASNASSTRLMTSAEFDWNRTGTPSTGIRVS
jgi:hypothetical protein